MYGNSVSEMNKCIAFHSYKGGTGKTTLSCNCAAVLTRKGYNVCLLDLDVYAPALQSYFGKESRKGINDFLNSTAKVEDVMIDITELLNDNSQGYDTTKPSNSSQNDKLEKPGKLWVGFSNPQKEEIFKLEMGTSIAKRDFLRRFIHLRQILISDYHADYIIIDTSPGVRFWSINALAIADILLLTLKMGDLDIDGTKKVVEEIYKSFTTSGSKAFLLSNRIAGYCIPPTVSHDRDKLSSFSSQSRSSSCNTQTTIQLQDEYEQGKLDITDRLSHELGIEMITSIPCYCDIQFLRKEFLTVLRHPGHPFSKQIERLIEAVSSTTF